MSPLPKSTLPLPPIIQTANALSLDAFRALYFPSPISLPLPLPLPSSSTNPPALSPAPSSSPSPPPSPSPSLTLSLSLSLESPSTLSNPDLQSCLDLIASTSASAYRASAQGWRPTEKKREMKLRDMKYLLLRGFVAVEIATSGSGSAAEQSAQTSSTPSAEIQGFASFLLTVENTQAVIYIYEIHLRSHIRGLGLGSLLMNTVEGVGSKVGVEKAMLTCFEQNVRGRRFYEVTLGYGLDEGSPEGEGEVEGEGEGEGELEAGTVVVVSNKKRLRGGRVVEMKTKMKTKTKRRPAGYVILSKSLKKKKDGQDLLGSEGRERERGRVLKRKNRGG